MKAIITYLIAAAAVAAAYFTKESVPADLHPQLGAGAVVLAFVVAMLGTIDNLVSLKVRRIVIAALFALYGFAAVYGYDSVNPQSDLIVGGVFLIGVMILFLTKTVPAGCCLLLIVFGLWTGFNIGLIGGFITILMASIGFAIIWKIRSKEFVGCGAPICIAIALILVNRMAIYGLPFF
ncbi:hypothetical protein [Parasulfitobacter algicola]|uniref:Prepilin type IV endopeptidase peptidase domain-containing protein n=1 Tax=Parasulfitobacter algicola TaxID=2614809 RepID=A0ABX2IYF1_9RHOB|nr:hypothetical protein [Sulfitobacter algicola]NSX55268.1 hypothetical protein [Sulfitobacter algicola]